MRRISNFLRLTKILIHCSQSGPGEISEPISILVRLKGCKGQEQEAEAGGRKQEAEDRRQNAEGRRQKAEGRKQ